MLPKGRHITPKWASLWSREITVLKFCRLPWCSGNKYQSVVKQKLLFALRDGAFYLQDFDDVLVRVVCSFYDVVYFLYDFIINKEINKSVNIIVKTIKQWLLLEWSTPNVRGVGKICEFRQITRCMAKTVPVQDKRTVSMNGKQEVACTL